MKIDFNNWEFKLKGRMLRLIISLSFIVYLKYIIILFRDNFDIMKFAKN